MERELGWWRKYVFSTYHKIGTSQLSNGKTYAQSEPDITSAVAARATKWGVSANRVTQRNASVPRPRRLELCSTVIACR